MLSANLNISFLTCKRLFVMSAQSPRCVRIQVNSFYFINIIFCPYIQYVSAKILTPGITLSGLIFEKIFFKICIYQISVLFLTVWLNYMVILNG